MPWPPRLPVREAIGPEDQAAYDYVVAGRAPGENPEGKVPTYYRRLMLSPRLGRHLMDMGAALLAIRERGDSFSNLDLEQIDQIVSAELATNIILDVHIQRGVAAGVRIEMIEALRAGRDEGLAKEERQLADFVRKVLRGGMDREAWEAMEKRVGERGAVDCAVFTLYLQYTMRMMETVGMPRLSDSAVEDLIEQQKAGARAPA